METNDNENKNVAPDQDQVPFTYKRGDRVNYLGGFTDVNFEDKFEEGKFLGTKMTKKDCRPVQGTFIHAVNEHGEIKYVIQHPDGQPKEHFTSTVSEDGFEVIAEKQLKNGLLYIYCDADDLVFVSRKENGNEPAKQL